tara:strand:- start:29 stop:235 length:207 start_codon:yes stop_codon:yes gene_type:complete
MTKIFVNVRFDNGFVMKDATIEIPTNILNFWYAPKNQEYMDNLLKDKCNSEIHFTGICNRNIKIEETA